MSFALTTSQVKDKSKTVTRRNGWRKLKVGDRIQPVEKCMGLKKGAKQVKIGGPIVVEDIRFEPLNTIDQADVILEGFPDMTPAEFIKMYCKANKCNPDYEVTRIQYSYFDFGLSQTKKPSRPACRYYGGKWKIADWIIEHFPTHRCYVEGFGGAGSVLLKKDPARVEVYNDLSSEMCNLFRVLRDPIQSAELRRLLSLTPWSREEWVSCYELSGSPVEQARRTVVLCAQGHNPSKALNRRSNGWRSSSSGHHRLPQDFQNYTVALENITWRMKQVLIENRPAKKVCQQHDRKTTLHYLDPPYPGATRSTNDGNYYPHEMRDMRDHVEMFDWVRKLKGMVIVSGYDCKEYEEMYGLAGWGKVTKKTVTGAAITGKSKAAEILWLNPRCLHTGRQLSVFEANKNN